MRANDEAVRLSQAFRKEGVRDVLTSILPVREQGAESMVVVTYNGYQATAPANCGRMTGFDGPVLEHDPDYKLGCTVETVFARQIANPSDLLVNRRLRPIPRAGLPPTSWTASGRHV
jgi:type IV pilus biogenesis protein CpaD/CtpE